MRIDKQASDMSRFELRFSVFKNLELFQSIK